MLILSSNDDRFLSNNEGTINCKVKRLDAIIQLSTQGNDGENCIFQVFYDIAFSPWHKCIFANEIIAFYANAIF